MNTVREVYEAAGVKYSEGEKKFNEVKKVFHESMQNASREMDGPDLGDYEPEGFRQSVRCDAHDSDWFESVCDQFGWQESEALDRALERIVRLEIMEMRLARFRFAIYPDSVVFRKMEDFTPGELYSHAHFVSDSEFQSKRIYRFLGWEYAETQEWLAVFERDHDKEKTAYLPSIWRFMLRAGKSESDEMLEDLQWFVGLKEIDDCVFPHSEEWDWHWQEVQERVSVCITKMNEVVRYCEDVGLI